MSQIIPLWISPAVCFFFRVGIGKTQGRRPLTRMGVEKSVGTLSHYRLFGAMKMAYGCVVVKSDYQKQITSYNKK